MALIYDATLTPGKLEVLSAWVPGRPWAATSAVTKLATYRFDDPAGEVGTETFLLGTDGGTVLQVPLTYRGAPLAGAEDHLVATMEHSVLGTRWVYDGCADPIWVAATITAILTGGTEVPLFTEVDGQMQESRTLATVHGSGTPGTPVAPVGSLSVRDDGPTTVVRAGDYELTVARVLGTDLTADQTLAGKWPGGSATLAGVS